MPMSAPPYRVGFTVRDVAEPLQAHPRAVAALPGT
jgi:hypothetical protein